MVDTTIPDRMVFGTLHRLRYLQRLTGLWVAAVIGLTGLIGLVMLRFGPSLIFPAFLAALLVGLGVFLQPRYGLYLCLFLALAGDGILLPWYPFSKNLSSPESILYVADGLIFSPLEVCLVGILLIWLSRELWHRRLRLRTQHLFWPTIAFSLFVVLGLLFGLATGGDLRIALWEARPLLYLPVLLILTSHLLTHREHLTQLLWVIALALSVEGLIGAYWFIFVLRTNLPGVGAITEHSAPVHMNLIFVLAAAAWIFGGSRLQRWLLPLMAVPMLITYLAAQRRAAIAALIVALGLMALVLYQHKPRLFWLLVPIAGLSGVLYLAVFWNSSGALGTPARTVKAIVAPEQASLRDQSSNAYRLIENANVLYTIQQAPLTGVGFGRKFTVLVPMPDISFFEWWEYIVHNSILWIWIKTGVLGFLSLLYLVGTSIVVGLRALWRMPTGELRAITLAAVLFLVMHCVYAYVDMSWDIQSMVLLGTMLGLLNSVEVIVERPVSRPSRRWPWQAEPPKVPGLL